MKLEDIERIKTIKQIYAKGWLAIEGVVAVGIGMTSSGGTGLIVSVKSDAARIREQIPNQIEDIPVEIQETGEIKAL
jgi:hypothetical protein